MKKVILCTLLLLAGCAKMPEDIAPAAVSADPYMQMDCASLSAEQQSKQTQLKSLGGQQTETSNRDKAWMAIVHVPVASMSSDDLEPQIANLKGQVNAINQASQAKACPAA